MKVLLRRYLPPALGITALYLLNRFCLIPATTGTLHRLLAWHGADFLAGGAMVLVLQGARELSGQPLEHRWWAVLGYLLLCGLVWEGVTPLDLPRAAWGCSWGCGGRPAWDRRQNFHRDQRGHSVRIPH